MTRPRLRIRNLLESYPPQPGGATLEVVGLDPSEVDGLQSDQGMSWTDHTIQVLGTVEDGELIVDTKVSG